MSTQADVAAVERYWTAMAARDFDAARRELHDGFTGEWPQSGERIRGRDNWLAIARAHPTFPAIGEVRHLAGEELVVTHATFDYARDGSPPYQVCAVQQVRDGKILSNLEFFGAPFEAAEWRAAWVEGP